MTKKEEKNKQENKESNTNDELTIKSLIAQSKGIEPLIIGVFIIIIYWIVSAVAFILSCKFGRL